MTGLGKKIHAYRVANGLTQEEMAELCGLTRVTICNLEADKYRRPNFKTLKKVYEVLNLEMEDKNDEAQ